MAKRIGIIAEDKSDVEVINALIRKITTKRFSKDQFVGEGHGKIIAKCRDWAENLGRRGCGALLIVHDLDDKNEKDLAKRIADALRPSPIAAHLIVIPIREIEAWLLADHAAIKEALNIRANIKLVKNPQAINRPKEYLRDLIYSKSGKKISYVNTIHNLRIAERCKISNLLRCSSFVPLQKFIKDTL